MAEVIHGEEANGGTGTGYIGIFSNFTALITAFPTAPTLSLAYVQNSQGTPWLPGNMGGTFYSKGSYLFDGVNWVSAVDDIAKELQDILDTINTQNLFDVLTEGNSSGGLNIKMGAASILFGGTDLISVFEDGSGGWCLINNSGGLSANKYQLQNGTTVSTMLQSFTELLLEQTSLFDSGKIRLVYAATNPELILESDQASGGFHHKVLGITPLANRTHILKDEDGTLAHESSILGQKAGVKLNASFGGNPKKATVTFGTAFADANYTPCLVCETVSNTSFTPVIESVAAGSFVINMDANNINNLTSVRWTATKHGEAS